MSQIQVIDSEKTKKVNIMVVFEKKFFYMYLDILSNFINNFGLIEKKNGNDIFVSFYGYISSNIEKCVESFSNLVENINRNSYFVGNSYFLLYDSNSVHDVEYLQNILNYCLINKNGNNIINVKDIIDLYNNYCYALSYIEKILDNTGCISFYKQNIYKPNRNWNCFDVVRYEVLSRIKVKDDNILQPSEFFQIVEKTPRLFEKFELCVFDNAMRLLKVYNEDKILHFNFSSDFIINYHSLLSNISKDMLNKFIIEINEKSISLIKNSTTYELTNIIKDLNKKNFRFVFDDFGEGVNNIELLLSLYKYLKGIKIGIKIFSSLFQHKNEYEQTFIVTEEVNQSVFLIKFFESFQYLSDLSIYYEGIDSQYKLNVLSDINVFEKCYLQGFYFHKPEKLFLNVFK